MSTNYLTTTKLTWNPATRTFSAEVSDFGHGFNFDRVYADSCDLGVVVVSHKTGKAAKYAIEKIVKDEGEVVSWELVPTRDAVRMNPTLRGTKVVLFND